VTQSGQAAEGRPISCVCGDNVIHDQDSRYRLTYVIFVVILVSYFDKPLHTSYHAIVATTPFKFITGIWIVSPLGVKIVHLVDRSDLFKIINSVYDEREIVRSR
jgi:hypothetical protein